MLQLTILLQSLLVFLCTEFVIFRYSRNMR